MGCFTVLKYKKKKTDQIIYSSHNEDVPTVLPEPQLQCRLLKSAPPSFRTRVKSSHPINKVTNNRTRALSAPSALDVANQDALNMVEFEEREESRYQVLPKKEQLSSSPQPLPLPSSLGGGGALKATSSFKSGTNSGPLYRSARDAAEQDALASVEYEESEESKHRVGLMKEQSSCNPRPLPLPSPQGGGSGALKANGSFKLGMVSSALYASEPLPLPPTGLLRNFPFEEIAAACHNFSSDRCTSECLSSTIYSASFGDNASSAKKFEATVTRLHSSTQGLKEFVSDVNTLASLQHPNLCKLLGFHARDGSDPRMLVYERLCHGSLDRLLFGRSDGPSIDWNSRMKIAICAAQGLAFLHEEGPFQAMYKEFSTANIQIEKDFSAKLSGYGCVGRIPEDEISTSSSVIGNLSVETFERGILTPKSNVWCFGIILLELLTGRKNLDSHHPKEERNIVKWSRPFLADNFRLSLIMDPRLKGRFPPKAARTVANIAQRCLQKDPSERPTMRTIVERLKMVQDMKYSCWFPLQEPAAMSSKQISRSPSLNGIICHAPRLSISPPIAMPSVSSSRWAAMPTLLHLRACSSTLSMEDLDRPESRQVSSPVC